MSHNIRSVFTAILIAALATGCNFAKDPVLLFGDTSSDPDYLTLDAVAPPEDTIPGEDTLPPPDIPPDLPPLPDYCCWSDDDCPDDLVCTGPIPRMGAGTCEPPPGPGECWHENDCTESEHCVGVSACPCEMDCDFTGPGKCVPDYDPCCHGDEDCLQTNEEVPIICVGADIGAGGVCLPQPPVGNCYDDDDCPDDSECGGATICSCDMNCMSEQGWCSSTPMDLCCDTTADCPADMKCVDVPGADQGTCLGLLPPPECWDDGDCGQGMYCDGANPCPCDYFSPGDGCGWPGMCQPYGEECCLGNENCPFGQVCAPGNTCETPPDPGQCFNDWDCYETQSCEGIIICPCGELCFAPTTPGLCSPLPQGCCNTDADCPASEVCRGQLAFDKMPGSCVPDPGGPECPSGAACCWNDDDCPGNDTCVGASVCGCIELCYNCGDCMPDVMGFCMWY